MADAEKVLGPGAKGDPEDPAKRITAEDLADAKATEVVEAVESGVVTPDQAREAEEQRDKPRKTVERAIREQEGNA